MLILVQAAAARQLSGRVQEVACAGAAMATGDVCNACPHPVAFRSAYQLSPTEQWDPFATVDYPTNCSQVIRAIPGTTAHLWLCLTPWEMLAPGATLHLPLDAPVPAWVLDQNATESLWWQYTAHVADADGSAYSLTRGTLGSQLLRVVAEVPEAEQESVLGPQPDSGPEVERVPCYPPHAPTAADCTWWTRVRKGMQRPASQQPPPAALPWLS